jgi:hypothetical protein
MWMIGWVVVQAFGAGPIPVQGAMIDAAGAPITGTHALVVRLSDGDGPLDDQDLGVAAVFEGGRFSVALTGVSDALLRADDLTIAVGLSANALSAPVPVGWAARAAFASDAGRWAAWRRTNT